MFSQDDLCGCLRACACVCAAGGSRNVVFPLLNPLNADAEGTKAGQPNATAQVYLVMCSPQPRAPQPAAGAAGRGHAGVTPAA
jgi:hypothetical protein